MTREFHNKLLDLLADYRMKAKITEVRILSNGRYYICPRCRITLERDYQRYCDRCGQRLDWRDCLKASVIRSSK